MSIILNIGDVKDNSDNQYTKLVYDKEGAIKYIKTSNIVKPPCKIDSTNCSFEGIIKEERARIRLIYILQMFDIIESKDLEKYILLYVYTITKIMIDNDYKASEFKYIKEACDKETNERNLKLINFKEEYLKIAKNMFDIALKRYVIDKKTEWSKVNKYGKIVLSWLPLVNRFMTEGAMASDKLTPDLYNKLEGIEKKFREGEKKISENELKAFSLYKNNDEKITSIYYINHKENFKKEHINNNFSLITCILLLLNHLDSTTQEDLELVKLLVHKIYSEHIISMRKIDNNVVSS